MGETRLDPSPVPVPITNNPDDPIISQEVLDTVVASIVPGTVKVAGVDWFVTEVNFNDEIPLPERAAPCVLSFAFTGNDSKISITRDGVNFTELYEGVTLFAGKIYEPPIQAENGNIFNIRSSEDVTIRRCVLSVKGKQPLE